MTKIGRKLKFSALIIFLLSIAVFVIGLVYETNYLYQDYKENVREHVDTAYGVLVHYNSMAVKGLLTKEQAQDEARDVIRKMVYGNGGYFWIHNSDCVLLMHPVNPEYEGQYRCDFADKNGKLYYRDFNEKAKSPDKSGYVKYVGPKMGAKDIRDRVTKISYVRGFEPWGWVVGSGFYEDIIFQDLARKSLFYGLLYGIFIAVCIIIIMNNLAPTLKTIHDCNKAIDVILDGRTDFELHGGDRTDEIGDLVRKIEQLSENYTNMPSKPTGIHKDFFLDCSD